MRVIETNSDEVSKSHRASNMISFRKHLYFFFCAVQMVNGRSKDTTVFTTEKKKMKKMWREWRPKPAEIITFETHFSLALSLVCSFSFGLDYNYCGCWIYSVFFFFLHFSWIESTFQRNEFGLAPYLKCSAHFISIVLLVIVQLCARQTNANHWLYIKLVFRFSIAFLKLHETMKTI